MLHKIKRNLIILNTVLTSIILSIVITIVGYININQIKNNKLKEFSELSETIEYKLQNERIISNSWLSKLEAKYKAIISIEDNGEPFLYRGSWEPLTSRYIMIKKAKEAALSEGIDTKGYTISSRQNKSSVHIIKGNHKENAFASVCIIPKEAGYMSLTLIQFHPREKIQILMQIILYMTITILGSFSLFLVSCFFVGKVLKPAVESQKRQNEFIAAASHDLRSPLAVIQTNASALLIEGADKKHFLPKIIDECTRMSRLIGDMLILATSDAKTWQIRKEVIDSESYLIDLYDSLSAFCSKKNHKLALDLPDNPLPQLHIDKDRLTQVLGILIDNAISYSPEGSCITIRPYIKKSLFRIEVEDHGCGITREQKEKIFHRFYRVDKSRNDNTHFGLGLSVAKELMELQSGKIFAKDTLEGGATFVLEFPL